MQTCSAVILAGGRATRLGGANKALLEIGGRTVLQRVVDALHPLVNQTIVVGHLADDVDVPGLEVVIDCLPERSTLGGIYTGLQAVRNEVALIVGCDMPFLSTDLFRKIAALSEGYDLAVPRVHAHLEALHAAYRKSCLPAMERAIQEGSFKIVNFYSSVRVRELSPAEVEAVDPELLSFFNINTPEDLAKARSIATQI